MTWTDPDTVASGGDLTAAIWNEQVRDNLKALGDAWAAYGSGSSWTSSTLPSLGNGTWDGAYMRPGKFVAFRFSITMGSTTTFGSGSYSIDLQVAAAAGQRYLTIGAGTLRDAGSNNSYPMFLELNAAALDKALLRILPSTAGNQYSAVNATSPFTFADTDVIVGSGFYEAA